MQKSIIPPIFYRNYIQIIPSAGLVEINYGPGKTEYTDPLEWKSDGSIDARPDYDYNPDGYWCDLGYVWHKFIKTRYLNWSGQPNYKVCFSNPKSIVPLFIIAKTLNERMSKDSLEDLSNNEIGLLNWRIGQINEVIDEHNSKIQSNWKIVRIAYSILGKFFSLWNSYRFTAIKIIDLLSIQQMIEFRKESIGYTTMNKEGDAFLGKYELCIYGQKINNNHFDEVTESFKTKEKIKDIVFSDKGNGKFQVELQLVDENKNSSKKIIDWDGHDLLGDTHNDELSIRNESSRNEWDNESKFFEVSNQKEGKRLFFKFSEFRLFSNFK